MGTSKSFVAGSESLAHYCWSSGLLKLLIL